MNAVSAQPPIFLSSSDLTQIERLLARPEVENLPVAALLADELARATVLPPAQMPADVVTMNSSVVCVETQSGKEHHLTLTYPAQADISAGKVSILTPMGSALLGLSVGQIIDWPGPAGRRLSVQVTQVSYPPEVSGRH